MPQTKLESYAKNNARRRQRTANLSDEARVARSLKEKQRLRDWAADSRRRKLKRESLSVEARQAERDRKNALEKIRIAARPDNEQRRVDAIAWEAERSDSDERRIARNARQRARERIKRVTDPMHVFKKNTRCRLRACMKRNGIHKTDRTQKLLGCTWQYAMEHLESNDRGLKLADKDIHIDHIRPFDSFKNLHCEFEQRTVNHYLNLQLLTAEENYRKGSDFDYDSWAASDAGKQLLELNRQWRMERFFQ
jgi:hypothetical protein